MQVEQIIENSYKNFHAKGLNYICLLRTPLVTLKAYFFEGDISTVPECVIPHNHRYDFQTEVLAGTLNDNQYKEVPKKILGLALRPVQRWEYRTPLNGGKGFQWASESFLHWQTDRTLTKGQTLFTPYDRIHTISVKPDTVLLLTQMKDKLGDDEPSLAYSFGTKEQKPNTKGLYEKFKEDEVVKYLKLLEELGVSMTNA